MLSCKGVLIIHQRGHVWVHETRLTTPLLIEVSVPNQESERSCMCVLDVMYVCVRVSILPLSTIFLFDFGIVYTVWPFHFVFFI